MTKKAAKKTKKASQGQKKAGTKTKHEEEKRKVPVARMLVNKVVIGKDFDELAGRAYGKVMGKRLELAFVEALYLLEKEKIVLTKNGKKISFSELMSAGLRLDPRLHEKYVVYSDLRERGLVVKTGFKFGCDFRVYKRGVGVKKGPKGPGEHTKWIVFVVPEDYTCAFQELSRAVRLAHSIRARMLWSIVDNENNVTYYEVLRLKP